MGDKTGFPRDSHNSVAFILYCHEDDLILYNSKPDIKLGTYTMTLKIVWLW